MKKYFIKYKLKIKMSTTDHLPKISDLTSATGDISERKRSQGFIISKLIIQILKQKQIH